MLACLFAVLPLRSERSAHINAAVLKNVPPLVLWAWERPEDLSFINPDDTAVAFLAETIRIEGDTISVRPRLQPLTVPDRAKLIAVTRIEVRGNVALSAADAGRAVAAIVKSGSLPRVIAVQVDFDALRSQKGFYAALLVQLRRQLRPELPISITALASWCFDDDWISGLPIDEAVPMLFRMGAGTGEIVARLNSGRDFRTAVCRESLGVSTDEPWTSLPTGRRLYVFQPSPWTKQAESAFLWKASTWH